MWISLCLLWSIYPQDNNLLAVEQLIEKGEWVAAQTQLQEQLGRAPMTARNQYLMGRIQYGQAHWSEAISAFKKATEAVPGNADYHYWLGSANLEKLKGAGHFQKGILAGRVLEALKTAIRLNPDHLEARKRLAHYYLNAPSIAGGSRRKALEQAGAIMKRDPAEGTLLMAGIQRRGKKYDAAIQTYNTFLEDHPGRGDIVMELGMTYFATENYAEAIGQFERSLALNEADLASLYLVGKTAAVSGLKLERGIECLGQYLARAHQPGMPGHDGAYWRLGMIYAKMGQRDEARLHFEKAIQLKPQQSLYRESLKALNDEAGDAP